MTPSFVAFPGTVFSSKSHYIVFLKGDTPVTSRLLKPALIDAETGKLTDSRDMPWYVTTLFISQPLHFGDYGGMPLQDPLGSARRADDHRPGYGHLSLAAQAQGRCQRRTRHRARLCGQCPHDVLLMVLA